MNVGGVLAVSPQVVEDLVGNFANLSIFLTCAAKCSDEGRNELIQVIGHIVLGVDDPHQGELSSPYAIFEIDVLHLSKDGKPHLSNVPTNEESASQSWPTDKRVYDRHVVKLAVPCPACINSILLVLSKLFLFVDLELLANFFDGIKGYLANPWILVKET